MKLLFTPLNPSENLWPLHESISSHTQAHAPIYCFKYEFYCRTDEILSAIQHLIEAQIWLSEKWTLPFSEVSLWIIWNYDSTEHKNGFSWLKSLVFHAVTMLNKTPQLSCPCLFYYLAHMTSAYVQKTFFHIKTCKTFLNISSVTLLSVNVLIKENQIYFIFISTTGLCDDVFVCFSSHVVQIAWIIHFFMNDKCVY